MIPLLCKGTVCKEILKNCKMLFSTSPPSTERAPFSKMRFGSTFIIAYTHVELNVFIGTVILAMHLYMANKLSGLMVFKVVEDRQGLRGFSVLSVFQTILMFQF